VIIVKDVLRWSGALRRKLDAHPAFADWLTQAVHTPLSRKTPALWLAQLRTQDGTPDDIVDPTMAASILRRQLRQLRARVFYALMVRDLAGVAPLQEVVSTMSALADLAIGEAYRATTLVLSQTHGIPRDPATGCPQEILMLGLGKLGGRELNVSSDIDLIPLYSAEGQTDGRRRISYHEFYGRVVQRTMAMLSELDADGQVFRTDLRLRPDGNAGPLAWSLDALEHYLIAQGREWERYAWIKARPITCRAFVDSDIITPRRDLEALRVPFVYRKYFDFDALAALRTLRERIREDWQRRAHARTDVDAMHNIKLGDGGIREIEFVVQLNQLIRGGRMPSLQRRSLLGALEQQRKAGVLGPADAQQLHDAYVFLRQIEHRLQYREDAQTHLLPHDPAQRADLAATMGMTTAAFETALSAHRAFVSQTFHDAFRLAGMGDHVSADTRQVLSTSLTADPWDLEAQVAQALGEDVQTVTQRIATLLESPRLRALPHTSRTRVQVLIPRLLHAATQTTTPAQTALRLLDLVETIAARSAYLALLAEYPATLARMARMLAASAWASQYIKRYPHLLDRLIEWHTLLTPLDFSRLSQQLRNDLDACTLPDGQPDVEQQMNLMRDVQRQATFHLLAQDLEGRLGVEALADALSALADLLLQETINRVWPLVQTKGSDTTQLASPRFAVLAYGRLGGKELGYASDLDLVFLTDEPQDIDTELYTRLARRVVSWLSTLTSSGRLYDIDLRLRPNGDAGLLAISFAGFARYQRESAWNWEHQAITRARFAAGDPHIGARFEALRREILLLPRDAQTLKAAVREMRERIHVGHPNPSADFDLKHDRGGMVDVEFITQYLVLQHARTHPVLLDNLGNIALLQLAACADLIPQVLAQRVVEAYRSLRRTQHAIRLQDATVARVSQNQLQAERQAVIMLWQYVLDA